MGAKLTRDGWQWLILRVNRCKEALTLSYLGLLAWTKSEYLLQSCALSTLLASPMSRPTPPTSNVSNSFLVLCVCSGQKRGPHDPVAIPFRRCPQDFGRVEIANHVYISQATSICPNLSPVLQLCSLSLLRNISNPRALWTQWFCPDLTCFLLPTQSTTSMWVSWSHSLSSQLAYLYKGGRDQPKETIEQYLELNNS